MPLLIAIVLVPFFFAAAAALVPSNRYRPLVPLFGAVMHLLLVFNALAGSLDATGAYLGLDALGGLILLAVSLLYTASSIYAVGYFQLRPGRDNRVFIICLLLFLSAMSLAALARHLGLLWVAVEATTLVSAPLIYYNQNRFSIEATWKYLVLCSLGIALAMLGILFLAYADLLGGGRGTLQFDSMLSAASSYSQPWLRAGFVFLLVGFGVKMGLAPLHSWKPDAYGEAPGLVGGLLAGGLTSVAFLAVLRAARIMNAAGQWALASRALLALGVCSLIVAALFVIRQRDLKRMLAYSSVEHMGLLAIGVSLGGMACFGAMFHVLNNALVKGVLFMTAGNIHRCHGSKRVCEVRGSLAVLPLSGGIFLVGFLAIAGTPPFGVFISEFTIMSGVMAGGNYMLAAIALTALAVIFIGMSATVLPAVMGPAMEEIPGQDRYRDTVLTVLSPLALLLIVLGVGVWQPAALRDLLMQAALLLEPLP